MCYLFLIITVLIDVTRGRPNIIFILADDLGFNDVGYHNSEIRTPNIDLLAKQGVRLDNYYVQPVCTPTRSQLLSGRYQIHTGLQHGVIKPAVPNALPTDSLTVADKLKEAGYSTHCVGKWHLGFYKEEFLPTRRGFDTFYGFLVGSKSYYSHQRCNGGMCGQDWRVNERPATPKHEYSTTLFSDRTVDIIDNHKASQPLFIYLPYQAVHGPLQVPKQYLQQYSHIKDNKRRIYAGMVTAMDEGIGNITEALKRNRMWSNTLLIFSTDNGGQHNLGGNNYPLRGNKGSLFEAGIRAVGFASGGFLKNRGKTSNALIHVSDWFPTFVNLAGGNYVGVKPLDGVDQWQTINRGTRTSREILLHNIDPAANKRGKQLYEDTFDNRVRAAIRFKQYKLLTGNPGNKAYDEHPVYKTKRRTPIEPRGKNIWLFDIEEDPSETKDLSDTHPQIVRQLLEMLEKINSTAVPVRNPPIDPRANPKFHGGYWGPWL